MWEFSLQGMYSRDFLPFQRDRMQDIIRNKSDVWLDWIELINRLNKFEMFVSSFIHEKNIENCLF